MMKTNVYLVRHAETIGNIEKRLTGRQEYELTISGKNSTIKLVKKLKDIRFDKIYSSTSKRTLKTIEPLSKLNNVEIEQLEDLCEMYFGIYDGWKWEEVNKINPQIKEKQNKINEICGIPEQETMNDVADRVYNCISKIVIENIGKNILICSHGVAIEAFLRKIVNLEFKYDREKFCQHNCALNKVVFEDGKFIIEDYLADISFLEDYIR